MGPIAQVFDVSAETPFSGKQMVVGWLFAPDDAARKVPQSLVVCLPGGTYSKSYFHFILDGFTGYSMAEYFVSRDHLVLALDPLGAGESTRPEEEQMLTRTVIASIHHAVVKMAIARLADGSAATHLPPVTGLTITGLGHSMGGMLVVTQQGRHETYDRIAPLGWVNVPSTVVGDVKTFMPPADAPRYIMGSRADKHTIFYMEDVPEKLIAADDAAATTIPVTLLSELLSPGISLEEAKQIYVPVFIGFGERDMSLNPHLEPSTYPSSTDVTLYILKGSAHCHNFASSRRLLWDRLCNWIERCERVHPHPKLPISS